MYLNIPGIPGESQSTNFTGQIVVNNFSGGVNNSVTVSSAGITPGTSTFTDITITKYLDSASTPLYLDCAKGTQLPTVVLSVTKPTGGGGAETAFYIVTMNSVVIKSVQNSLSGSGQMETLVLSCGSIQWSYAQQSPVGTLEPPIVHGWDMIHVTGF
jgi:type VI secretion system secreted protein Hcp